MELDSWKLHKAKEPAHRLICQTHEQTTKIHCLLFFWGAWCTTLGLIKGREIARSRNDNFSDEDVLSNACFDGFMRSLYWKIGRVIVIPGLALTWPIVFFVFHSLYNNVGSLLIIMPIWIEHQSNYITFFTSLL